VKEQIRLDVARPLQQRTRGIEQGLVTESLDHSILVTRRFPTPAGTARRSVSRISRAFSSTRRARFSPHPLRSGGYSLRGQKTPPKAQGFFCQAQTWKNEKRFDACAGDAATDSLKTRDRPPRWKDQTTLRDGTEASSSAANSRWEM